MWTTGSPKQTLLEQFSQFSAFSRPDLDRCPLRMCDTASSGVNKLVFFMTAHGMLVKEIVLFDNFWLFCAYIWKKVIPKEFKSVVMVSKCPILSGIVRSNVRFTEVCMIRVPLSARPQSLRLACKLLLRKQSLIPWLAYNTLSSESFCTMASVSSYPGPQTEISTGNSSPKLHARMVYSETGKDNPGQPSAADIDQRLKDWESDIDIKKLTVDSHKKIHHCHLMAVKVLYSSNPLIYQVNI